MSTKHDQSNHRVGHGLFLTFTLMFILFTVLPAVAISDAHVLLDASAENRPFRWEMRLKWDGPGMGRGAGADWWARADVDGDGNDEVLQLLFNRDQLSLFSYGWNWRDGKMVYEPGGTLQADPNPKFSTVTDVDGDGRDELLQVKRDATLHAEILGLEGETWKKSTSNLEVSSKALGYLMADVDGDGKEELVQAYRKEKKRRSQDRVGMIVFKWFAADNRMWSVSSDVLNEGPDYVQWLAGDVDGDGRDEVLQLWRNKDKKKGDDLEVLVYGWRDDPHPGMVKEAGANLAEGTKAIGWAIADFDGDGRDEVLQLWEKNKRLNALVYGYDAGRWSGKNSSLEAGMSAHAFRVADVEGDGKAELIQVWTTESKRLALTIFGWEGDRMWQECCGDDTGQGPDAVGFVAADVDGDGKTEVIQAWENRNPKQLAMLIYGAQAAVAKWNSTKDVSDSIKAHGKYDPAAQEMHLIKDNSAFPAFPFDGTADLTGSPTGTPPKEFARIVYRPDPVYQAQVFLFPGVGDNDYFNKPLIVSDAFDSFDVRHASNIYSQPDLANLLSTDHLASPRALGYDLYFIDFSQGAGDILVNAALVLEFVEWMHTQTGAPMIVGGPSMSGVVTRLALLYALPENHTCTTAPPCTYLAPNVSGYISIDSPQQGASLDPSYPMALYRVIKRLSAIPVVGDSQKIKNAREDWKQLLQPATLQMLYARPYIDGELFSSGATASISDEGHRLFYTFLDDLGGYNHRMPLATIAYSNFYLPHPGYDRTVRLDTTGYIMPLPLIIEFFSAGGDPNHAIDVYERAGFHDLAPGSVTARFYYDLIGEKVVNEYVTLFPIKGEGFKGTFIPIYSALDLDEGFDILNPQPMPAESLAALTEFDAVYYMEDEFNCYKKPGGVCRKQVDDRRYQHIFFDDQLMEDLASALGFLESICTVPPTGDWHVPDGCALLSPTHAPGNVVVEQGVTLTITASGSLDIDFARHNLRIKPGGKVLIKPGGKIE